MTPTDDTWQFHLSMMQSEPTTPLRAEAFEVFMAEAARVRLHERCGPARVHMRSGTVIAGELASPADGAVEGHVLLVDDEGRHILAKDVGHPGAVDETASPVLRLMPARLLGGR